MESFGKAKKRTYSKKWEKDPELEEWIQGIVGDSSQAYCKYCKCLLHPHRRTLKEHARTKKHKANIEEDSVRNGIQLISRVSDDIQIVHTIEQSSECDNTKGSPGKIRRRTFSKKWECDPILKEWVRGIEGNSSQAYCKYCSCKLHPHRKVLLEHAQTKKHKNYVERARTGQFVQPINRFLNNSEDIMSKVRKKNELRLVVCFIIEHCNIEVIDRLGELLSSVENSNSGFKNLSIDHTKSTALIVNVIAPSMHKGLIEDIGESYFSLIVGKSLVTGYQISLAMIIRYASKSMKKIVSTFYKIITVVKLGALSLKNAICNAIAKDGLNLQKCIGLGIDGTSIMDITLGVTFVLFREKVPHIQVFRCLCFSLNLIRSKVSEILPQQVEFLVYEIYKWFSYSSKRQEAYRQIFKISENEQPLQISRSISGNWLSRGEYIAGIIDHWDLIKFYLNIAYNSEKCHAAKILIDMMNDSTNKLYLIFLKISISELNTISNLFQHEVSRPIHLMSNLIHYYKSLLQKLVIPDYFAKITNVSEMINFQFENYVMNTLGMPFEYDFELECQNLSINDVLKVKEKCKLLLIKIAEELNSYISLSMKMIKKLEIIYPNNALQPVKSSITPLAIQFMDVCEDLEQTEVEWNNLVHEEWTNKKDEVSFWFEVMNYRNSGKKQYNHISKLALSLLTLPISNASVEIVFSALNEVKNKITNSFQLNTINSLLQIKFNLLRIGKDCRTFQPSRDMLERFDNSMYEIPDSSLLN